MRTSDLERFLNGSLSPEEFMGGFAAEVSEYKESLSRKGGSVVIGFHEDVGFKFSNRHAKVLLQYYLDDQIDKYVLEYIGDALELGERVDFSNELVQELVFDFCNPVINGEFTRSKAENYLAKINA